MVGLDQTTEKMEAPLAPAPIIISFLNKVWRHPLLDEKTIDHRRQFPEKFKLWCQPWGVNPQTVSAVLVGSSLWTTDRIEHGEGSDWDFILYGPDGVINALRKSREEKRYNEHGQEIFADWDIHPDRIYASSDLKELANLAPLLLTPDNFIAGNLELARQYRLKLLDMKDPHQKQLNYEFDHYMRGWPSLEFPESRTGDRRERFENVLNRAATAKAKKLGIPIVFKDEPFLTKFKELFKNAMQKIEVPSLEIYKKTLEQTKGALILPPNIIR